MLTVKQLFAEVDGEPILRDFSLTVNPGEIHALMGPNGAGKSTFAKILAGYPHYTLTGGEITFLGQNLLELDPEERARQGLFVGLQYPVEVFGVTNCEFLYAAHKACRESRGEKVFTRAEFEALALKEMEQIGINPDFLQRDVNCGFSGGEKKRNEILQMAIVEPKLAVLDETDSGLDVDAMRIVAKGVQRQMGAGKGLVVVTHYHRLLEYIKPTFVHIVIDGAIACSGGADLARDLEKKGYEATVADHAMAVKR